MELNLDLNTLLYLTAIAWATFFSYMAIKTRDILYSVAFLIGMYVASAWALIQLGAWFLALMYLFINAGGVLVLIIFAAMLTRPVIDIPPTRRISLIAIINSFLLIALIAALLISNKASINIVFTSDLSIITTYLFNNYGLALVFLAVAALAIYLGSIYIASEEK